MEGRFVERRGAPGRFAVALRSPECRFGARADFPREVVCRGTALARSAEPRGDLGQVVGESLAAASTDVAHESGRAGRTAAAHERLAPVRRVHRRAERPVRHAARLVLVRGLVEHADAAARIALLRTDDRAHAVAELLVLRIAGRTAGADTVSDHRLDPG